ncbi:uncharacterized protein CCR75_000126 [Bremia lactucae]|uniref:Endonuclease/exonuclease/phosphatase domain-containing protein n=1 Tax=Bremia lactucae TaxID=4779 RepID=A0A976IHQ9_BRELC|nr:hypothetical protein CCR75_000126 [Bremia lactucae]
MYQDILSRYQVIAFQETKLTNMDSQAKNDYFLHAADAQASVFWSNQHTNLYQNRNGVALVFSGAHPFHNLNDVTQQYSVDPLLNNRYLVVAAQLGSIQLYFHVIYGPVLSSDRSNFFQALPRNFDDSAYHLVLGDFNITMDSDLDQARSSISYHNNGRPELFDWMITMGLIDFWRLEHPDTKEFTGPKLKNRIDYCLASVTFYDKFIRTSGHVFGSRLGSGDHIPVEFSASSAPIIQTKAPFKCPPWLLQCEDIQYQLYVNLQRLLNTLDPFRNPGCILDEHKRQDRIFLSKEYLKRKTASTAQLRQLLLNFQEAKHHLSLFPSDTAAIHCDEARQAYFNFNTALRERNSVSKFDSDVATAETSSKDFFRAPTAAEMKLTISSVNTPTGISRDLDTVISTHREYWGKSPT